MTDDKPENAEALLEEAKNQSRHETDPVATSDGEVTLVDAVADAYAQLEDGELPENLTIRDGNLAALFAGLDETNELGEITRDAASALDRDEPDAESKAAALRLLVRVGLGEVAPDVLDAGADGYQQYQEQQDFEF